MAQVPNRYQPERAMRYLQEICKIGPRVTGSPGMQRQRDALARFFQELGGTVTFQNFEIRHPENGEAVPVSNLIATWHPNRPKRFLLCAHYGDPILIRRRNPKGYFVGPTTAAAVSLP